nr:reverse transcriptase domain-containing protein [Tanacetum cinerariifolium]
MKLNPKKCTFRVEEGMFLGYMVNTKGIKVCPDKIEGVLNLPSPKCLKDMQRLNGKLASLNRFLAKSAEKLLPFFKTLKKCTKKSTFKWNTEAEYTFKQMKKLIAELPTLTAPMEKEELIVYLVATKEAVSAVLMTKKETKQMPIYFVSRALQGSNSQTQNRRANEDKNLQTHIDSCIVANQVNGFYIAKDLGMIQYLEKVKTLTSGFKKFSIKQMPRRKNKKADALKVLTVVEEEGNTWMTPINEYLMEETLPAKKKKARVVRLKSRRYTVINGVLYKKSFFEPWLRCVVPLQANYVMREIHEGSRSMHVGPMFMVAKALRTGYYWPTMHKDARKEIRECQDCQVHRPVSRNPQQKLTSITSPWRCYK